MRETVGYARKLLGGDGILLETQVGPFGADAEASYSCEGTGEINTLIVGRARAGLRAFVCQRNRLRTGGRAVGAAGPGVRWGAAGPGVRWDAPGPGVRWDAPGPGCGGAARDRMPSAATGQDADAGAPTPGAGRSSRPRTR
jgi:hypothetical protein